MEDALLKYGLSGIVIIALAWFVMYIIKDHKVEKTEWIKALERLMDKNDEAIKEVTLKQDESIERIIEKIDERQKETNAAILTTGNLVSAFKTLFESELKRRK